MIVWVCALSNDKLQGQCTLEGAWSITNASCPNASDGSLCCDTLYSLVPGQGLPPYQCQIISPTGSYMYNSITNCFENLSPNTYTIQTTSSDGCIGYSINIVSTQYTEIIAPTVNSTPAACGNNNGSVCVNVSGGSGNYALTWIGPLPATTLIATNVSCISNLALGIYQLNVDDLALNGCDRAFTKIIGQTNLTLSDSITNTTCPAPNCNGSIDLTASGTAPYTYNWTGPGGYTSSTEDLAGLCPGTYMVNVTDANGCAGTGTYTITLQGADVTTSGLGTQANVISGNIVWNPAYFGGQTTIIVDADVIVNANAVLTINNLTVLVTPGHSIEGLVNSRIFGNNSIFDAICGDTWRGFEIYGSGSNNGNGINDEQNRADIQLTDCEIWHAECGIRNHNQFGTTYLANTNNFGGRITCDQTRFIDNVFDLSIGNYFPLIPTNDNFSSRISQCQFTLNQLPTNREQYNGNDALVFLTGRARIALGHTYSNFFTDNQMQMTNANYSNSFRTRAITLNAAKLQFTGMNPGTTWTTTNYTSQISGFYQGISVTAPGPVNPNGQLLVDLDLLNTQFNCHQGVLGAGNINVVVSNNRFDAYTNPLFSHLRIGNIVAGQHCAIYLNNQANIQVNAAMQFLIAHNRIQNSSNLNALGGIVKSYGVYLQNTSFLDNYIVENEIHDCLDYAFNFMNRNRQGGANGQLAGTHYECNTFLGNKSDVYIGGQSLNDGVAPIQGHFFPILDLNLSAGNNFVNSTNALPNDDVQTVTANLAMHTYRYHTSEISNTVSEMTTDFHIPEPRFSNTCGLPFPSITPPGNANTNGISEHYTEMLAKHDLLQAMIDDGDTYGVLNEVELANYTQAYALYLELMQKSPALSEEVLLAGIQKEYELPKSLLTLILAANPLAAKSSEIQQKLDERQDPLDTYQREQIASGKYTFSPTELLQIEIAGLISQVKTELLQMQHAGIEGSIYWSILENTNHLLTPISIEQSINRGEFVWAETQALEQITKLKLNSDQETLSVWQALMNIRNQANANGLPLQTSSILYLDDVQNNNLGNLGLLANQMLHVYCGELLLELEENELRGESQIIKQNSNFAKEVIAIWPIPSENFVNIKVPINSVRQNWQLLNATGTLVMSGEIEPIQTEFTIPLDNLHSGVYHFVISNSQGVFSKSFLKN